MIKNLPANQCRRLKRHGFSPWIGKIPWRRKQQPTPLFFPGEFHGEQSLAGYFLCGCKELDITEHAHTVIKKADCICNLFSKTDTGLAPD